MSVPLIVAQVPTLLGMNTFRPRYALSFSILSYSLDFSDPDNSGYMTVGTGVK